MELMTDNEKTLALQDGPAHLRNAAELSRVAQATLEVQSNASDSPEEITARAATAQALATIAQAEAGIATALVFATLAASEADELAEGWLDLLDPTGEIREAMEEGREQRRAEAQAEHEQRMADIQSSWDKPVPYSYSGPLVPAYGQEFAGPDREELAERDPGLTEEQIQQAGRELADSLISENFPEREQR
jgi:hypothetical protein